MACEILNLLEEILNKAEMLLFHTQNHQGEVSESPKDTINFKECYELSILDISFIIFIFVCEKLQAADGITNVKLRF